MSGITKNYAGTLLAGFALLALAVCAFAAEEIPPPPKRYFNDYAKSVSPQVAASLNRRLEDFEKATSNQIVVAIFPTMKTDSSIEDYTQRIFQAWKPGQKEKGNGAILFVFVKERKMRIHTGYGLEGALPDVVCKRIIDNEVAPRFRSGDFAGGLSGGVNAMLAAARGEYKGTGRTAAQNRGGGSGSLWAFIIFMIIAAIASIRRRGTSYHSSGGSNWGGGWYFSGGGGGGFSGGGDSGGFSGGGGDSGGGGASGSW